MKWRGQDRLGCAVVVTLVVAGLAIPVCPVLIAIVAIVVLAGVIK